MSDHETIASFLGERLRSMGRRLLFGLGAAYLVLQSTVFFFQYEAVKRTINSWIIENQPKIAELLYIENALAVEGLIQSLLNQHDQYEISRVIVFDADGNQIASEGDSSSALSASISPGFSAQGFYTSLRYFGDLSFDNRELGSILVEAQYNPSQAFYSSLIMALVCISLFVLFRHLNRYLIAGLNVRLIQPLQSLSEAMASGRGEFDASPQPQPAVAREVELLHESFRHMVTRLDRPSQEKAEAAGLVAAGQIASQVAHDIRSPLFALRTLSTRLDAVRDKEETLLLKAAVARIDEITRDLVRTNSRRPRTEYQSADQPELVTVQVLLVVNEILDEKRIQLPPTSGVKLLLANDYTASRFFVNVQETEFKRVLSNLIDNALGAVSEDGIVTVELSPKPPSGNRLLITVSDNGCGIPPSIIPKLKSRGATFGKLNGSGLGLYFANQCAERWGGSISLFSSDKTGTSVHLELGLVSPPLCYVPSLGIESSDHVVLVDDDPIIDSLVKERLERAGLNKRYTDVRTDEALDRVAKEIGSGKTLFLVDYHLGKEMPTGLDLIRKYDLASSVILISNSVRAGKLAERCVEAGVRFLPKMFIPIAPLF